MKRWNEEEINFLIENYPKYGPEYCSEMLHKSKDSIINKKKELKLLSNKQKKWDECEIDFLINNYSKFGTEYCVKNLNRSWSSIIGMATNLKLKAKKRNSLNKDEKEFLKINYPKYGCEYCMNALNRSKGIIQMNAHNLLLKTDIGVKCDNMKKTRKINNYKKYNIKTIKLVENKFIAYILGYLWADGYVSSENGYVSSISIVKDDADFLYDIMSKTSDCWNIGGEISKYWVNDKNEKIKAQNQKIIRSYSQELYYFLIENDFNLKSCVGFDKIFSKIPEEFKSFFLLGLYDGDGHFNYQFRKNKYHSGEFVITSSFDYDWGCLENYFNENNIEYRIYRCVVKLGRVSRIIVRKHKSLMILYDLLYSDDFKGLNRKYVKFLKYKSNKL